MSPGTSSLCEVGSPTFVSDIADLYMLFLALNIYMCVYVYI
jgi:hypothetical protein